MRYTPGVLSRSTRLVTCAVLIFQLASGMSCPLVRAADAVPSQAQAALDDCPDHPAARSGHHSSHGPGCCHTPGCHCCLTYFPPVYQATLTTSLALFTYLPAAPDVAPARAPIDEPLRPPIG
ncbi:MAG TPA: hypothetical protein VMU40_18375 [Steroidobacteraceae bacterium]|nr:hypothetical protein [Steroidobacteraceae bacterium]